MEFQLSFYLDTRHKKHSGSYRLKLRVWNNNTRKAKLYPVDYNLSEEDFNRAWISEKPRKEFMDMRIKLNRVFDKANEVAEGIHPFTFESFEKKFFRKIDDGTNVFTHYQETIDKLKEKKQIATAGLYELSRKSFKEFLEKDGKVKSSLSFFEITPDKLAEYESFMLEKGKSRTTISIYLRALRTIFNNAIYDKDIPSDIYPFGKRKYQIPSVKNVKKSLSKEQLKKLFDAKPQTLDQEKARDFWFFSYSCNGMNIKDIALLKFKNLDGGRVNFFRAKTITTKKEDLKEITAYLNEFTQQVIHKYGNKDTSSDSYVFPILEDGLSAEEEFLRVKYFTRFVNQHMKKLVKALGLPDISTYWARHSFATNAIRNGASMELIQESLGHGDLRTTMTYFAGFEDSTKKDLLQSVMNFG